MLPYDFFDPFSQKMEIQFDLLYTKLSFLCSDSGSVSDSKKGGFAAKGTNIKTTSKKNYASSTKEVNIPAKAILDALLFIRRTKYVLFGECERLFQSWMGQIKDSSGWVQAPNRERQMA